MASREQSRSHGARRNSITDVETTCEALHKINKHAKKYAQLADKNYRRRKKATARYNSIRKKALYSLKTKVLKRLYDRNHHDRIEIHEIDGREYYCFYIDDWSYHSPIDDWPWSGFSAYEIADEEEIENFSADADTQTEMSLKSALLHLNNEVGRRFNANEYLEEEYVDYGYQSYFAGWDYLG